MIILLYICVIAVGQKQQHAFVHLHHHKEQVDLGLITDDSGLLLKCNHHRYTTLQTLLDKLDIDNDGCLNVEELRAPFDNCLTWYERLGLALGKLFGSVETPEAILAKCDVDEDHLMCMRDAQITGRECTKYAHFVTQHGHEDHAHHCLCDCAAINGVHSYVLDRLPCS